VYDKMDTPMVIPQSTVIEVKPKSKLQRKKSKGKNMTSHTHVVQNLARKQE